MGLERRDLSRCALMFSRFFVSVFCASGRLPAAGAASTVWQRALFVYSIYPNISVSCGGDLSTLSSVRFTALCLFLLTVNARLIWWRNWAATSRIHWFCFFAHWFWGEMLLLLFFVFQGFDRCLQAVWTQKWISWQSSVQEFFRIDGVIF